MKQYEVRTPDGICCLRTDLFELAQHCAAVVLGAVYALSSCGSYRRVLDN